jgi:hypothetical protein
VLQRFKIPRKARSGLSGVVYVQSEPAPISTPMEDGWCVDTKCFLAKLNEKECFLSILLDVGGGVKSWDDSYLKAGVW